jgi:ketosteroid isomerase-like protein
MDKATFQDWLDRYLEAWRSNDRDAILPLFTADAEYRYHPWDEPLQGRDAIADSWLEEPDVPDSWSAEYHALAVDGDVAVASGVSRYLTEDRSSVDRAYHNVFLCRFEADGRCREFTEFFMLEKRD